MIIRSALLVIPVMAAAAAAQPITHPADSLADRLQPTTTPSDDPVVEPRHLWTLGVLAADHDRYGLRLQADLFSAGGWSLGVAGVAMQADTSLMSTPNTFAAGAYVARTADLLGPLRWRAQLGANIATTSSYVDAAVMAELRLGSRAGIVGGPIVQLGGPDTLVMFAGLELR
jgi:hypothetical protein